MSINWHDNRVSWILFIPFFIIYLDYKHIEKIYITCIIATNNYPALTETGQRWRSAQEWLTVVINFSVVRVRERTFTITWNNSCAFATGVSQASMWLATKKSEKKILFKLEDESKHNLILQTIKEMYLHISLKRWKPFADSHPAAHHSDFQI